MKVIEGCLFNLTNFHQLQIKGLTLITSIYASHTRFDQILKRERKHMGNDLALHH